MSFSEYLSVYFALYSILHWTFLHFFLPYRQIRGDQDEVPLIVTRGSPSVRTRVSNRKQFGLGWWIVYLICFLSIHAGSVGRNWRWAGRGRSSSWSAAVELTFFPPLSYLCLCINISSAATDLSVFACLWVEFLYAILTEDFYWTFELWFLLSKTSLICTCCLSLFFPLFLL